MTAGRLAFVVAGLCATGFLASCSSPTKPTDDAGGATAYQAYIWMDDSASGAAASVAVDGVQAGVVQWFRTGVEDVKGRTCASPSSHALVVTISAGKHHATAIWSDGRTDSTDFSTTSNCTFVRLHAPDADQYGPANFATLVIELGTSCSGQVGLDGVYVFVDRDYTATLAPGARTDLTLLPGNHQVLGKRLDGSGLTWGPFTVALTGGLTSTQQLICN